MGCSLPSCNKSVPTFLCRGVDVLSRAHTHIPVEIFDGFRIPFPSASFDVVLFFRRPAPDGEPDNLLQEASRITKHYVLIKDHSRQGVAAHARLRFMDWVGNARFGVSLALQPLDSTTMARCLERNRPAIRTTRGQVRSLPQARQLDFRGKPALHRAFTPHMIR
jgi:hypothetical protein